SSTDQRLSCGPSCSTASADFPRDQMVTITAAASGGSFLGWSGDCRGTSSTCRLTMSARRQAVATFGPPAHYAFVTSTTYVPGNWGSVGTADSACNTRAAAAGLPAVGSYRAWLSTSTVTARSRLTPARGWIRTDGLPVADTAVSLVFPVQ